MKVPTLDYWDFPTLVDRHKHIVSRHLHFDEGKDLGFGEDKEEHKEIRAMKNTIGLDSPFWRHVFCRYPYFHNLIMVYFANKGLYLVTIDP